MFKCRLILSVLQISVIENVPLDDFKEIPVKIHPKLYQKTAEILHNINKIDDKIHLHDDKASPRISIDYLNGRTDNVMPLMNLMKLIQKNYDASKKDQKDEKNKIRVYYINNPDVLEEYRKRFRARSTSSSSDDEDYDDEELRIEEKQRRNAASRTEHFSKDGIEDYIKKPNDDIVSIKEYENAKNVVKDDVWDIITKKYEWSKENRNSLKGEWDITKTTKQKLKKDYKPKSEITEYENIPKKKYKARKKESGNGFHAFGRTSIPYIGNRGVFDDK